MALGKGGKGVIILPTTSPLRWGSKLSENCGPHKNLTEFESLAMGHALPSLPSSYHSLLSFSSPLPSPTLSAWTKEAFGFSNPGVVNLQERASLA